MKHEAMRLARMDIKSSGICEQQLRDIHTHGNGQAQRGAPLRRKNGLPGEIETKKALEAAQRAGVTQLEYIRAHLQMKVGISQEEWRDDGAGDEEC